MDHGAAIALVLGCLGRFTASRHTLALLAAPLSPRSRDIKPPLRARRPRPVPGFGHETISIADAAGDRRRFVHEVPLTRSRGFVRKPPRVGLLTQALSTTAGCDECSEGEWRSPTARSRPLDNGDFRYRLQTPECPRTAKSIAADASRPSWLRCGSVTSLQNAPSSRLAIQHLDCEHRPTQRFEGLYWTGSLLDRVFTGQGLYRTGSLLDRIPYWTEPQSR